MTKRSAGLPILVLSTLLPVVSIAQTTASEIVLTVTRGPGPLDVTLQWTGGQPSYEVLRSASASAVCNTDSLLGVTDGQSWIDPAPPDTVFYKIRSPFAAEPSEVCNGVDDDCNGIIDDNAVGCDAGACQACVNGACRSRCGACDDCIGGTCQTRCGACETCVNGTCGPCNPVQCQTCASGVCQSTCDDTQCLACGPNGTCASFCATCETCLNGACLDACDHSQCLSCQSGSCKPFCDPVCQTCTPQGCSDTCGPCQRCANGACHTRCDPNACEDCIDGQCRSRCAPDETCMNGVCSPSSTVSDPF
jgi:hypothetical protein